MNTLKMSKDLHGNLWSHLLPANSCREQAAFLFCKTEISGNGATFEAIDQFFLSASDFVSQYSDYIELTNETRIALIKRAHALGASLVELHSHPGPLVAAFSLSDRIGLRETVPHMRWRLKGRPYLAIVVAPSGFDALVWLRDVDFPESLVAIDVEGMSLIPTNLSLDRWHND